MAASTKARPNEVKVTAPTDDPHIGRLQSGQAGAEHRIDWKLAEELDDGSEKRVVGSKHHRRSDESCIEERGPDRQFAFSALSDVPRL